MAGTSNIEWCDATWNPVVGCSIVSPGCTNCYAMRMAARLQSSIGDGKHLVGHYSGTIQRVNGNAVWTGHVARAPEHILTQPLTWRKGRRIFVNSMSDLFHESIPDEWIDHVFAVMALCPQHTFQVLTKRAERMRAWFARWRARSAPVECVAELYVEHPGVADKWPLDIERASGVGVRGWPLPNVWLGISAERQQEADERIPHLLQTPAAIRFVSFEPLLGPIGLSLDNADIDWAIVGGESGPSARPMNPEWARVLRDQCAACGIPYFFKQWGAWAWVPDDLNYTDALIWLANTYGERVRCEHHSDGRTCAFVGKHRAGRLLDRKEHNEFPISAAAEARAGAEFSATPTAGRKGPLPLAQKTVESR